MDMFQPAAQSASRELEQPKAQLSDTARVTQNAGGMYELERVARHKTLTLTSKSPEKGSSDWIGKPRTRHERAQQSPRKTSEFAYGMSIWGKMQGLGVEFWRLPTSIGRDCPAPDTSARSASDRV